MMTQVHKKTTKVALFTYDRLYDIAVLAYFVIILVIKQIMKVNDSYKKCV